MEGGRFAIQLEPLADEMPAPQGMERAEFVVSANPGQPLKPLTKVASGGELSRISLAIQVITASQTRIPTLIFDEVDVGIGGRVAEIVGHQLRALAGHRQVICVTHLPQVAALGHHHLQVSKRSDTDTTISEIQELSAEQRVDELARMLGGIEITEQTLSHAREMIERARVG
jgi:DNA repair protein RecN (Recombination protein N)